MTKPVESIVAEKALCKAIALADLSGIERRGFAVGASPSGKAPDFDSGIRRFDPSRPSQPFTSNQQKLASLE